MHRNNDVNQVSMSSIEPAANFKENGEVQAYNKPIDKDSRKGNESKEVARRLSDHISIKTICSESVNTKLQ
jgi:hypothetical protein